MTEAYSGAGERSCFVIGPIGDRLALPGSEPRVAYELAIQVFEEVIEPACSEFEIRPTRSDGITKSGDIPEQIIYRLATADLVIADLTGANPNVMYELGLRHAVGLPTIQIGERGKLPFDISTIRTIQFRRTAHGLIEARNRLRDAMRTGFAEGFDRVTAARVLAELRGPLSPPGKAGGEETPGEAPGFLELIADMEDAQPQLTSKLQQISNVIERMGELALSGSAAFTKASEEGKTSATDRLLLVRRFAESLDGPAAELETLAAEYETEMGRVDAGVSYLIGQIGSDPKLLDGAPDFPASILKMAEQAREGLGSIESLGGAIASLGQADRGLRSRTSRIATALNRVVSSSAPIFTWERRLSRLAVASKPQLAAVGGGSAPHLSAQKRGRLKASQRKPRRG